MGLTRADRKQAVERLDAMAEEISLIASWLDQFGGAQQDADRASVLLECCARDLAAACWQLRPSDHTLPPDHLASSRAMRA
jgi:hypothetical protein